MQEYVAVVLLTSFEQVCEKSPSYLIPQLSLPLPEQLARSPVSSVSFQLR